MKIVRSRAELSAIVAGWRRSGERIGVVPTMGALHDGHLSLVRAAKHGTDRVVVTIFVNPTQFNNPADLDAYPRTEEADAQLLRSLHPDVIFAPPASEVYPSGFVTKIIVGGLAERLEGVHRPGHFDGVATVVAKLFGMTRADLAYFGEKDWQQLQVVRRLVADLNMAVEIVGCPTIRESDGLARSSRNSRLSAGARRIASALPHQMQAAADAIRAGESVVSILEGARAALVQAGFERVEYFDLCDRDTLLPLEVMSPGARLLAAAWVGGVRLIDNIAVD